jgi:RNA polymerase sigma factor (sigma-70 family)
MQTLTDDMLLEQIKAEDNASFRLLYTFYFPSIASYIKQNMGSHQDAEDIFQEAVLVLWQKVKQPNFALSSSLKTYLYAIAKNLWLKHLRDNKRILLDQEWQLYYEQNENDTFSVELHPPPSQEGQVQNWLQRITENCRRILKAIFYYQESMESLMTRMGWKNKHTAANQKYKCIAQVKKEKEKEGA